MRKFSTVVMVVFMFFASFAMNTRNVSANDSGLSTMQAGIDAAANKRVDVNDLTTPGVTVLIKKGDEILHHKSYGSAHLYDRDHNASDLADDKGKLLDNPRPMTNDTIYDLASVTKVMATTQAVMMLVSQGKLDLDKPVYEYLPGFEVNGKDYITSRDLLTHTSGLPQWEPSYLHGDTRAEELEYVKNLELLFAHGEFKYSDFSFMALAFIIEEISGQPIEVFLKENFYGPLGMTDTMFVPLKNGISKDRIAATSWGNPYEWRMSNQRDYSVGYDTTAHQAAFDAFTGWRWEALIGEVNDGNAGMANEGVAGHAGLFSTAEDLSKLGDMMLNGGTLNGTKFYDESVLKEFTTKVTGLNGRGLGWASPVGSATSGYIGQYASSEVFSHDGFTGTQVIFDPVYDLQVIILSNKQNAGPYNDKGSYYSTYTMSREISQLAYKYVIDDAAAANKTGLQALYDETSALDLTKYVTNTTTDIKPALDAAKTVLDDTFALEVQIIEAYKTLEAAKDKLVLLANKTTLDALITKAEGTKLDGMTKKSSDALTKSLAAAKAVQANPNATQKEVDDAHNNLKTALAGLVKIDMPSEGGELPNTGVSTFANYLGLALVLSGTGVLYLKRRYEKNLSK